MKRLLTAVLLLGLTAAPALAADNASAAVPNPDAEKGKMLISSDGSRLAQVYDVSSDGPEIIFEGRMITVPVETVAVVDGKLKTSLTRDQVIALQ